MQITGTVEYNPVQMAKGKRRLTILRSWGGPLLYACLAATPYLEDKSALRFLNKKRKRLLEDPHSWAETNETSLTFEKLTNLISFANHITTHDLPYSVWLPIKSLLNQIQSDLVVEQAPSGWAIVKIDHKDIRDYHRELESTIGQKIHVPIWGPHISITRGEKNHKDWGAFQGEVITFDIDPRIRTEDSEDRYFYLSVESERLQEIRRFHGLPAMPSIPFHLTLGSTRTEG